MAFAQPPSLKARAIGLLSRREHSVLELRRKLLPHAEDPAEVESLLEGLQREGWLSQERFAESVVHRRASRSGSRRILQELRQHQLPQTTLVDIAESLKATEFDRAYRLWHQRFGAPPLDAREYARQFRFLANRGFAPDLLRRILNVHEHDIPSDSVHLSEE